MGLLVILRRSLDTFGLLLECLTALGVIFACAVAGAQQATRLPELNEIHARLDTLETQNALLARQNAELRHSLETQAHNPTDAIFVASEAGPPDVPMELETELQKLGGAVEELGAGMQEMKSGVEELAANLRVTTLDPGIKIGIFGWLRGEMLLSDARPILASAPFLLSPDSGLEQDSVDVHGKSTGIGAGIQGPCICDRESGGLILIYFFGNTVLGNTTGVFLAQAFGELKSDYDRLAFGVQADIFNPRNPTVVNWGMYCGAGNTGYLRGQLRYERFIKPSDTVQWTLTGGLSNPAPNSLFTLQDAFLLSEDNGWPNVEGRVALGLGCEYQVGPDKRRPFEVGVSGLAGQVRTTFTDLTVPVRNRVEADVWGVGADMRVALTDRFGVQGELYKGRGLGTYAGTILQVINPVTLDTIDSQGAWGEVYYYITPCLHTHWGAGIDDVDEADVALGQRTRNQAVFGNLMWDVTNNFQVAVEVSHWRTDYVAAPPQFVFGDNEGMIYHFRLQYSF